MAGAYVQLSVQREVGRVEKQVKYKALPVDRNLKHSEQLPLESPTIMSVPMEKGWSLSEQQVALLMNEESGPCTARCRSYTTSGRPT